jgi:hypothetical protein
MPVVPPNKILARKLKGSNHLEDLGIHRSVTLKLIFKDIWFWGVMKFICWALANLVINLWVPLKAQNYLTS